MPTIRIEKLTKHYGKIKALRGLNLQVEPGMVYGFLGPNGAGKTTTLRILSGLARADQGQAWIMGQPVGLQNLGKRPPMGVLPEEPAFYPWMTAREYLRDLAAPLHGMDARQAAQRTTELLAVVGLEKTAERRIGGFSRGMRQRLGLAQALIHQPPILLLDEPVSALDPLGRKEVLDLIEHLRGQATVLLSTHILGDVERICDTVGIIQNGRMVIESDKQALMASYALPVYEVEAADGFGNWLEIAENLPYVEKVQVNGRIARLLVTDTKNAQALLLSSITNHGLHIRRFETVTPSLEDIFLKLTGRQETEPSIPPSTPDISPAEED